jgi:hypothetical protein
MFQVKSCLTPVTILTDIKWVVLKRHPQLSPWASILKWSCMTWIFLGVPSYPIHEKSSLFMAKSPFLIGKSPFFIGKSTINGHFQEQTVDITRGY